MNSQAPQVTPPSPLPVCPGQGHPILALTDFSPPAEQALERAALLARAAPAPLQLLHVLPGATLRELRAWLPGKPQLGQRILEEARTRVQREASGLKALHGVDVDAACLEGHVLDETATMAEQLDVSMLVLGARGAGFLRQLVLGSTAERLLRRTARPLLVVRQPAHETYRRVLVALDFSPWSAAALMLARCIAPRAHLLLFHAWQVPFIDKLHFAGVDAGTIEIYRQHTRAEATQHVHAAAAAAGLAPDAWQSCIAEGDASLRMVELEQLHACDLVVLGKHGRSATQELLLGSTTKHVLAEGRCDVLVSTARVR
jgi:nucleotide-binding universal stress UspA family protein